MVQEGVWWLSAKRDVGWVGEDEQGGARGARLVWRIFMGEGE